MRDFLTYLVAVALVGGLTATAAAIIMHGGL